MTHVVIIGGGFGGLEACKSLKSAIRRGKVTVTLIDKENFFQFNPLLPSVATGAIETRHIVYPLRRVCQQYGIRFIRNKVRTVDIDKKILYLHNDLTVPYDRLIIAAGSTTNFFGIPGAQENAFAFKTLMDAIRLRAQVVEMWELADQATDPNTRRRLLTFVIAGGGITGVEVCSELMHMFHSTMKSLYPGVPQNLVSVHLVEAGERLLGGLKPEHSEAALAHLRGVGVTVVLNRKVTKVDQACISLDDGTVVPAHTLVWTTGIRGQPLDTPWPWPTGRAGKLKSDTGCKVADGVWAIGDAADCADETGTPVPAVAQGAMQMGRVAVHNLLAELSGGKPMTLRYRDLGYFVGLGKHSTVASLMGIPVSGVLAWHMWALVYLMKMVGIRKQFEVATDMIKSLFVDHDTSQIHERRRMLRDVDMEPRL